MRAQLPVLALAASVAVAAVVERRQGNNTCTVQPLGDGQDDVPQILDAFEQCGQGGTVVFPEGQEYNIAARLNPVVNNLDIEWRGTWVFSTDLDYWRNNSYPIAFQNHAAGFVLTGDGIRINGYGTGGINGNGDTWWACDLSEKEAGHTQPGRPMPFVFWNVSDVRVDNFSVRDPQLWSINIMNGTDMYFSNMYVNATATQAPYGENWVQNTDGFDTMDANNINLENLTYQGGDASTLAIERYGFVTDFNQDCIAIKPRSYNINVKNALCRGGNGMAIGSLGQYLEDNTVANVWVDNVTIERYNEDMENGAYIKTWIGELAPQGSYESAGQPRGGGWGTVSNVLFSNFVLHGPSLATAISQDSGDNGSFAGTSNMLVDNIAFVNFTGYNNRSEIGNEISCSERHPCFNISYENFNVTALTNGTAVQTTCRYTEDGAVHGQICT
ncbi:MAG: hypothetical protein Q9159_003685 [Coniocarpon cinnabarinum]